MRSTGPLEHQTAPTALRRPQQARSRDTLHRIVRATRELLQSKTFDDISVTEITRKARYSDKAALLDYLDEQYAHEVIAEGARLSDPNRFVGADLAQRVRLVVTFMLELHVRQPGLLRTLIVEARRKPGGRFGERTRRMNATIPTLMHRLLECREEIGHPEPERAVYLGLLLVFSAIREITLFPEALAEFVDYEHEELVGELCDAYLAYLRAKPSK
jgi:AcrR family transcriptional regulator